MNIAILGGRFDPPHLWHYWTARQILENETAVDQVWLLPDFHNAFRPIIASTADRLAMVKYLEDDRIRLCDIGVRRRNTYTVDTVKALQEEFSHTFSWVIGSDLLSEVSAWEDFAWLKIHVNFLVFPRDDVPMDKLPRNFKRVQGKIITCQISSSTVRRRVAENLPITGLVFPRVEEYIKDHRLYALKNH